MRREEFEKAARLAEGGARLEERDLMWLLPPQRISHREVRENTTAFVKGLPFNAGEELMLEVFASFVGTLRQQHNGVTAIRFGYSKRWRDGGEMAFDGMLYISFASIPLLKAFINKVSGYCFDGRSEHSDHPLRVVVVITR
jgi:hypothetical protein